MLWSDFVNKVFLRKNGKPDHFRRTESLTDSATLLYATALLSGVKDEIDRADAKASIMLASSGVAGGALLAGLVAGTWTPLELRMPIQWLWWLGVTEAVLGICCLGWVVYPRQAKGDSAALRAVGYYGDVLAFRSTAQLVDALDRSAVTNIERTADQIRQVSKIAHYKYRLIRWGMRLLFLSIATTSVAVITNQIMRLAAPGRGLHSSSPDILAVAASRSAVS